MVYILTNPTIRVEIVKINHDDPWSGGHFGINKTTELLQHCYWWPRMNADVEDYVHTCAVCQRMKVPQHKLYGGLAPLPQPDGLMQNFAMDFIVQLPQSQYRRMSYNTVLVVVDRYSKMVRFIHTYGDLSAVELADVLVDKIFARYGVPRSIFSDQGSLFTSKFWETFCYQLQVKRRLSTTFHPQMDG
jgi:transposase InsO family protein